MSFSKLKHLRKKEVKAFYSINNSLKMCANICSNQNNMTASVVAAALAFGSATTICCSNSICS